MKVLSLLAIFVLLFEAANADNNTAKERKVSFSIEKIWQSHRKKEDQTCARDCKDDTWKEKIQEFYDGCRLATWKFRGNAYNLSDTVLQSFEVYLTKLIYLDNSNSTLLMSSSTAILHTLKKNFRLNQSSRNILIEFEKVSPEVVRGLNDVASELSEHIGHLTSAFADAVDDLGNSFSIFMKEFLTNCGRDGCQKEIDYIPTIKKCQKLMNTVALIAKILITEGEASPEALEAVLVLTVIYWYLVMVVQGINSCVQDILFDSNFTISPTIKSSSIAFEYVIITLTQAIHAVVKPFSKPIKEMLVIFVNITMTLNQSLKDDLGLFDGVAITVDDISRNLFKGVDVEIPSAKGRINFLM